jgi:hypothetical protein
MTELQEHVTEPSIEVLKSQRGATPASGTSGATTARSDRTIEGPKRSTKVTDLFVFRNDRNKDEGHLQSVDAQS